ncbi:MAG TPA: apolipoprotein N-acyltransferase [Thermoanaerobaculia bacterium]|nr:apolipoprotein N-acyltransferase [Thermoanaerobaculia bacterium]
MSRRVLLLALLLAVAGGAAWGLAFGREPWTIASWLALAPLFPLLGAPGRRRWTFLLGLLHGLVAWIVALRWIVPTLQTYGGLPAWLAAISLTVLAGYLALYHGVFALLGRTLWRRGGAWALLGLPSLWVALEWLRTYLFGGFPWNPAGHAWVEVPGALPSAAWIGIYGVSWLVLFANGGLALAVVRRRPSHALTGLLLPLLVLAVGARWGAGGTADPHRPGWAVAGMPVRLLQPNISNVVEPDWDVITANYRQVLEMSEEACTPGSLVVWPESAAWPYSFERDSGFRRDVMALARRGRCTVLFNSIRFTGDHYYNSAYLVAPSGPAGLYDKRHLVPFGEYVPLAGVFTWLDKLARNAGNFRPAEELTLLPWRADELGMAICYEIVFPAEVAEAVREGATILTTITNDAWYGDTAAPWQHYVAARFRAAESRRPLLRAAITGVSAVVAPDGTERARLDPFHRGIIEANVEGERQLSPFTRAPWLVPGASTVVALVALAAAGGLPRRPRRQGSGGPQTRRSVRL